MAQENPFSMSDESISAAGSLAIISAFLSAVIVVSFWIAGFLDPLGNIDSNASGAVFAVGYFSFQLISIFLPIILIALNQRHGGLGLPALVGIGFFILAIPAGIIVACFMCWGSFRLIGTIFFGSALLIRQLAPRLPSLVFSSSVAVSAIVWLALRIAQGTLLEWGGLFGEWIPNLIGVSISVLLLGYALLRLGLWLKFTV